MRFLHFVILAGLTAAVTPLSPGHAGQFRVLFTFKGYNTGGLPQGGVILGPDNTLYGETAAGGTAPCKAKFGDPRNGCGTVYSLSKAGGFKVLVSFHSANGAYGISGLTLVGGTLYGTSARGGQYNQGVIFSVNTDGSNFTLLHQFDGTDGSDPLGPLVPGPNGSFYGILVGGTYYGSPTNADYCPKGCGVVFSFDPTTTQYTVLKTYDNLNGTNSPYIGSVAADGTICGNGEDLFSITLTGDYQVLAQGNPYVTGETPTSGPIPAPNGIIYGTYSRNIYGVLYIPTIRVTRVF